MVAVAGLVGSLVFLPQDQVTSSVCAGLGAACRDHLLQPGQDILLTPASTGLNAGQAKDSYCGAVDRLLIQCPCDGIVLPYKGGAVVLTNGMRIELRGQGTLVVATHSAFIDTRLTDGFDVPKHAPADVAALILDAVESGREEVLVDDRTRAMKAALPNDLELIYPDVERQWAAGHMAK